MGSSSGELRSGGYEIDVLIGLLVAMAAHLKSNRRRDTPPDLTSKEMPRPQKIQRLEEPLAFRLDVATAGSASAKFPSFKRPTEVASFSLDINRAFLNDRSMLKRFACPENGASVHFDLNCGYDTFIKKEETVKENLDDMLRCILLNRQLLREAPNFVCWRGLLTKILCTPYETRDGWTIAVSRFGGTLYMCECEKTASYPGMELMTYWGFKFEQYATARNGSNQPETDEPVNNKEAFCSVVTTKLDEHSLLYGGEVDCFSGDNAASASAAGSTSNYVELKTNRDFDHPGQERSFKRFKVLKWWAQSFLLGVPTVVCGFRDDAGIVHRIGYYKTLELPRLVRGEPNAWNPAVCFNFLGDFLSQVKRCVSCEDLVYVFEFRAGSGRVQARACTSDDKSYCFLPDWFRNAVGATDPL